MTILHCAYVVPNERDAVKNYFAYLVIFLRPSVSLGYELRYCALSIHRKLTAVPYVQSFGIATTGGWMLNWKNLLIATGFFGVAAYLYIHHGSPWAIGLFFAASLYLGVLAFTGLSAGGTVDLRDAMDFVSNPADALFERTLDTLAPEPAAGERRPSALGKIAAMIDGDAEADAESNFDPDAAIQRYMASRPADAPQAAAQSTATRTFGRRGL